MGKRQHNEEFDGKERRYKRVIDKYSCAICGEPLSKKEERNGICWACYDEEVNNVRENH